MKHHGFRSSCAWWAETASLGRPNIENSSHMYQQEQLKKSGLGHVIMFLSKLPDELPTNRRMARDLVEKWSRPIFEQYRNDRWVCTKRTFCSWFVKAYAVSKLGLLWQLSGVAATASHPTLGDKRSSTRGFRGKDRFGWGAGCGTRRRRRGRRTSCAPACSARRNGRRWRTPTARCAPPRRALGARPPRFPLLPCCGVWPTAPQCIPQCIVPRGRFLARHCRGARASVQPLVWTHRE